MYKKSRTKERDKMIETCSLCGTTSQDTAIFTATYSGGKLQVCLDCLSEGIREISKSPIQPSTRRQELMTYETIDEVYGLSCPKCKKPIFTDIFPIKCDDCGETINDNKNKTKNL